jgi:hypothetical protein
MSHEPTPQTARHQADSVNELCSPTTLGLKLNLAEKPVKDALLKFPQNAESPPFDPLEGVFPP